METKYKSKFLDFETQRLASTFSVYDICSVLNIVFCIVHQERSRTLIKKLLISLEFGNNVDMRVTKTRR